MEKYRFSDNELSFIEHSRIPYAVYQLVDQQVVTLALSHGFMDLFRYTDRTQAYHDMDHNMYHGTHPDDVARIEEAALRFAKKGEPYDVIYRSHTKNDDVYHIIHAKGEHVGTDTGVQIAYVWYTDEGSYTDDSPNRSELQNVLKNALFEESILRASYYDHLTGLPSMTYFFELAVKKKDHILASGGSPAMLFTDFGGMKYFNQKFGFAEGDKLLQAFAKVLSQYYGSDNCSRLGQDHFGVVTREGDLEETLEQLFEECRSFNNGMTLPVHVGIHLQRLEDVPPSVACDRAKLACDALRNRFDSCCNFYNMTMRDQDDKRQYIIANLDKAIEERWITVFYQPIVRAVNGRVCDEEALARWIDPVRGFMSPGDFIPILEDVRLIYKLDLYILDRVLEKMHFMQDAGYPLIPQSINLSRSDFDCCDIVEEIHKRVDAAKIPHQMITIEITESIVGSEFEFMKEQIERFRKLGFSVWMDDFGSGYSSLDVLQDIQFDLIKFDMRFMHHFDEGDSGKIILTELIKMVTSLGIDTLCEGVETEQQVQFLQETGCTKLQGYYFDKPIPVEKILEKYEQGRQIGFEDPRDLQYFETVGRVNLHDLSIIAQDEISRYPNFYNAMPMSILEFRGDEMRILRSNRSYRAFIEQLFQDIRLDIPFSRLSDYLPKSIIDKTPYIHLMRKCAEEDTQAFLDDRLPGNQLVHSCIRKIAYNPNRETTAIALAVLSISKDKQDMSYANIARALAADYFNLYYVDMETEEFIAYTSNIGGEELAVERNGQEFFSASRRDAQEYLYQDDREDFIAAFTKENVVHDLDEYGVFTLTYRLLMNGEPVYVHMKALRMPQDPNHIIIGVSNVDSQMKQQEMLDRIRQDQIIYSRIMALSGDYICLYIVDKETNTYVEYSAADVYAELGLAQKGTDFFTRAVDLSYNTIMPEDQEKFRKLFNKENVLCEIREKGLFKLQYRLMLDGKPKPVNVRAALVREDDGEKLIVGINIISEEI